MAASAMMFDIQFLSQLLRAHRRMPDMPPSEFSPFPWHQGRHHRFTEGEVARMKSELRRMSPATYCSVYPEEGPPGSPLRDPGRDTSA